MYINLRSLQYLMSVSLLYMYTEPLFFNPMYILSNFLYWDINVIVYLKVFYK